MRIASRLKRYIQGLYQPEISSLRSTVRDSLYLQAKLLAHSHHGANISVHDRYFRVHSQFGEDGILQGILLTIALPESKHSFLEIGVGDYSEANTPFLLFGCSWRGAVVDSCIDALDRATANVPLWRYPLVITNSRVTVENINEIVAVHSKPGQLGVLSIDVDGNDYWLWEKLEYPNVDIIIIEYNALWGATAIVSVPYSPHFERFKSHFCGLYWGSSLQALAELALRKKYHLVATSDGGNNAFFVHERHRHLFPMRSVSELYRPALAREARSQSGELSFLSADRILEMLKDQPLVDHRDGQVKTVAILLAS